MDGITELNSRYLIKIKSLMNNNKIIKGFGNYLSDISIASKYNYLCTINRFIETIDYDINQINLDSFTEFLSNSEYKNNGESNSSSYRITVYAALKRFSMYLYASGLIDKDYMSAIKRPKAKDSQKTINKRNNGYLTDKETISYIKNIKNNNFENQKNIGKEWNIRDLTIIQTFLNTGIRCSALLRLDVDSINIEECKIYVTDKGNKVKECDISNELMDMIVNWMNVREKLLGDNKCDALFISNKRRRMDQSSVYRVVSKYNNIKGKNITPHKLRATYGTQLYNATNDIYFVQDCMGHSSPHTTELYIRGNKNKTKKASDIMSKLTM